IDESTRYDRRKLPEKPPSQRAHGFFSRVIIEDDSVSGKTLERVETVEREDLYGHRGHVLQITTDKTCFQTDGESIVSFAESQGLIHRPSMARIRAISASLVSDMVMRIFDTTTEQPGRDYAEMLEELLVRHTQELVEDMGDLAVGAFRGKRFNALATLLITPT